MVSGVCVHWTYYIEHQVITGSPLSPNRMEAQQCQFVSFYLPRYIWLEALICIYIKLALINANVTLMRSFVGSVYLSASVLQALAYKRMAAGIQRTSDKSIVE